MAERERDAADGIDEASSLSTPLTRADRITLRWLAGATAASAS